jgi:predicted dienelactone hydrolase
MNRFARLVISFAAVAPMALLVDCGGDTNASPATSPATPPPAAITVSIAPASSTVSAGGTQALTATLQNDSSQQGVTWTIAPASGAGMLSNATATSVSYTAPANPPANDVIVNVTATSLADPGRSAAATIRILALSVTVDPSAASVEAGATQTLTATVQSDPAHRGVTWTISPSSGAGTLSNATNASVTYTAPATPPASDVTVIVTATSMTDATRSGGANITLLGPAVFVDPSTATLDAGGTQTLTASVIDDSGRMGVTWVISPTSGAGTLTNATSTSVTYNAPMTFPASDLNVTITATSVLYPTLSTATAITVKAIVVSVTPRSALIPIGAQQSFTSTVDHDPGNQGVTWRLSQGGIACAPACGTLSSSDTTTALYVAPGAVAASPSVTLTAASVTNSSSFASALITLSAGAAKVVPNSMDFGRIKYIYTKQLTATLTNVGGTALAITSITVAGSNPQKFPQTNNCGVSVAAGSSCDIQVTFTPKTAGSVSALLIITDGAAGSPQQVTLSGIGCATQACLNGAALSSVVSAAMNLTTPAPTGSRTVGTRVMQVTDANREDPFLTNGSKRELMLRFWYPAVVTAGCRSAPYMSPEVWSYFSALTGASLPTVRTHSCLDARVADGAYPIVVFSHGLTGTFTDYTFLFEDLASRGYIVVSVDHTYEATAVAFADGRMARSLYGSHLTRIVRLDESALWLAESARVDDVRFVIDELQRLNVRPSSPFAAHLDTAAIATAGHSLGALTALQALESDARIRAAIALDGGRPDAAFAATDRAVLLLDAGREEWGQDERGLWSKLHGPRLAVNLRNAEHMTPSDAVWLARGAVRTGGMSPETTIAAMRNYVAAFLDAHLQGRPEEPLLKRRSPAYPDAEITLQQQVP